MALGTCWAKPYMSQLQSLYCRIPKSIVFATPQFKVDEARWLALHGQFKTVC